MSPKQQLLLVLYKGFVGGLRAWKTFGSEAKVPNAPEADGGEKNGEGPAEMIRLPYEEAIKDPRRPLTSPKGKRNRGMRGVWLRVSKSYCLPSSWWRL